MINETYRSDYDIDFMEQSITPIENNHIPVNNHKNTQQKDKNNKSKGFLKLDLTKAIKIQEINIKKKEDRQDLK